MVLFAVIADFKLECADIELGCQCPLKVRSHDTVSMVVHEGLEILAEFLQPIARDAIGKRIEGAVQATVVERDVHILGEARNGSEHLGE